MLTSLATLEHFAETHLCPECGRDSRLAVRWNGAENRHQVWCPTCRCTEGFIRPKSLTQQWRENPESVPVTVANRLAEKYGKPTKNS